MNDEYENEEEQSSLESIGESVRQRKALTRNVHRNPNPKVGKTIINKGKNKITVKLWSGNRNLLGPHHYLNDEDSKWVGPHAWELIGSWKDGVSSLERENYALVRFGLFDGE